MSRTKTGRDFESSGQVEPRLGDGLGIARASLRSPMLWAVAVVPALLRLPGYADWLGSFHAFTPQPIEASWVPPFTTNWLAFTSALSGSIGWPWLLCCFALSSAGQAVLISLTHQHLFGEKPDLGAAARNLVGAVIPLSWFTGIFFLASPLVMAAVAVLLLPLYLVARIAQGDDALGTVQRVVGDQLASVFQALGLEISGPAARSSAMTFVVYGVTLVLMYPWFRLTARALLYDYSARRAKEDKPGERTAYERRIPVQYGAGNYEMTLTRYYYAGAYSEKDRMADRGLSALLHHKALALKVFLVSTALDLVCGPVAGIFGLVTIGWLLPAEYASHDGYAPYSGVFALYGLFGVVLPTAIVLFKTTLWTFLYHTRTPKKDE